SDTAPTMSERVSLYLELSETHTKLKNMHEAAKVMQDAMMLFAGTPEEDRITIANADLALERGEVDQALAVLSTIKSDAVYFIDAKSRMADIYLKFKNDRKAYARCYSEMVERNPTIESCLLLGDAYMNIQEPEQAISVYESAIDSNPDGSVLASKIGKALIKTHDYARAITYYESALANDSNLSAVLRYDLAELYKKLKQYDDADRVILEALDHPKSDVIDVLLQDVKLYLLLAQVYKGALKPDKAIQALLLAKDVQIHILSKEAGNSDTSPQKKIASDLCYELAELFANAMREPEKALGYYNEAIQYYPLQKKSMLALCKLYMAKGDLTSAQTQCTTMLRMDVANEEATMMIADINFRKNSYATAVFHFRQLLSRNPTHYTALAQLIEITRRSGKMDEAGKFFEYAEKSARNVHLHPGYHYCKGLHEWYTNNPNGALKEFNFCRRDTEWGERALYNMIQIFLNPDNDTLGGEALESVAEGSTSGGSVAGGEKSDSELLAILTADKLLKELPQSPKSLRTQILECHALMATRQKNEIERALARFMEISNVERDCVPALLGMAVAYMLLKQPPRARNQLKRIAKMQWTTELAEDFERSWLLLADIYIQGGKYDLATELLKRALAQNRSCSKAWEYLGFIMEKEASYKDAAEHYENAWKLSWEADPSMGFKLAFNHLKAKRFVEAIDVCHKVLNQYPEYPKMRKEILDKARASLRMP
ncbi:tetratricopeptide repeat domain 21B, partial [Blyttiomyces helicus]